VPFHDGYRLARGFTVPARVGLVVAGLAAIGTAASSQPASASRAQHVILTGVGAVVVTVWPALAAQRRAPASILVGARVPAVVSLAFLILLCWTVVETPRPDRGDDPHRRGFATPTSDAAPRDRHRPDTSQSRGDDIHPAMATVHTMEDKMPESRNVQLLKENLGALQSSDGEKMASMLHPDLQYWVSPGSAFSGTHDKASLLSLCLRSSTRSPDRPR
jgi:hypothetical protein